MKKLYLILPIALLILCTSILLISGCSVKNQNNKSMLAYEVFVKNVESIRNAPLPDNYTLITESGEELNKDFTIFPEIQKLDSRKNDSINGDMKFPSRYKYYFLNNEKTILVRLNLIYSPEFTETKIISVMTQMPRDLMEFSSEYLEITNINMVNYLIAFNGGLADLDFILTNEDRTKGIEDINKYIINEGENKFIPFLQEILLSFNRN